MFGKNKEIEELKEKISSLKETIGRLERRWEHLQNTLKVEKVYDVVSEGAHYKVIADRIRRSIHHDGVTFYRGESEVAFFTPVNSYIVIEQDK